MLFNKDWRNRRKLYPLYAELRHYFDITIPTLCNLSIDPLGAYRYSENPNKKGFVYQFDKCQLQVEIKFDSLVINLGVKAYESGHSRIFENFSNECLLRNITGDEDGDQRLFFTIEAQNQHHNISRLCTKAIDDLIKLDALIKETMEERRIITEAFEKTETDFLLPFCQKLNKENTSDTITAFHVGSGQSNIVEEEI